MQIEADAEVSLFVRDRATGRLVFNSKAIEALGLSPAELAQRGYPLDSEASKPAIMPEDSPRVRDGPMSAASAVGMLRSR